MREDFERAKLQMAMLLQQEHRTAEPGFFGSVKKHVFSVKVPLDRVDRLFLTCEVNEPLRVYASTLIEDKDVREQVKGIKEDKTFDASLGRELSAFRDITAQPLHVAVVRGTKKALPKNTEHVELAACRSARQRLLRALAKDKLISFNHELTAPVSISQRQASKLQKFIEKNSM